MANEGALLKLMDQRTQSRHAPDGMDSYSYRYFGGIGRKRSPKRTPSPNNQRHQTDTDQ